MALRNRKLKDVALSDQVYAALRRDLIAGHYPPGEKITISSLAESFGVSPTPVREAIRLLLAEGALDLKPNHSVRVAAPTARQYREIAEIRMRLEGLAASTAAVHGTAKQLRALVDINTKMETARAAKRYTTVLLHNREFHFALAEMGGMEILASVLETMWLRSGPLLNLLYAYGYREPVDDHPHMQVIAAIRDRDGPAAEAAIRRDIELGTRIIVDHLDAAEAQAAEAERREAG